MPSAWKCIRLAATFAISILLASAAHADTLRSDEHKFSVGMPGTAAYSRSSGYVAVWRIYSEIHDWFFDEVLRSWRVTVSEFPKGTVLDIDKADFSYLDIQRLQVGYVTKREVRHGELVGRELEFTMASDYVSRKWLFAVENKAYELTYIGLKGSAHDKRVNAFFESFHVFK